MFARLLETVKVIELDIETGTYPDSHTLDM